MKQKSYLYFLLILWLVGTQFTFATEQFLPESEIKSGRSTTVVDEPYEVKSYAGEKNGVPYTIEYWLFKSENGRSMPHKKNDGERVLIETNKQIQKLLPFKNYGHLSETDILQELYAIERGKGHFSTNNLFALGSDLTTDWRTYVALAGSALIYYYFM